MNPILLVLCTVSYITMFIHGVCIFSLCHSGSFPIIQVCPQDAKYNNTTQAKLDTH